MPSEPRSILIIRYSSMGDVLLTAPCISFLRERFPEAAVTLITSRYYRDFFRNDKRLSAVIGSEKGTSCREPQLLETEWDLIVDLQNNHRSAAQIAQLKYTVLRRFNKLHLKRNLLLFLRVNRYRTGESIALRYIRTCAAGLPEGKLDFSLQFSADNGDDVFKQAEFGDIDRPVVAFFPFSAWRNKEWPEKYFISVGHYFSIKGWNIIILGGKEDKRKAETMQYHIGERCRSLAGELSLHECGIVLKRCNLALGGDTGLSHLARSCGVKTGFLFGPTTVHFGFQPDGDDACTVFQTSHFCRPCHPHGGNFCWCLDHRCMKSITPELVISGLMRMYHGNETGVYKPLDH
ncbi:MAG: glycosyltransferase family 9 protein [Chitinispirillaceae bacterium]|nr:glycosyltransferase family 9 protein [Chitinispirillaceae bacterium]